MVHHGGIGTVAEALTAGTPQLIRPLCFDQPDNGHRIERLGAGLWIAPRRSTSANLAIALRRLMTPATRDRCRVLSQKLADNHSLDIAADLIERLAAENTEHKTR